TIALDRIAPAMVSVILENESKSLRWENGAKTNRLVPGKETRRSALGKGDALSEFCIGAKSGQLFLMSTMAAGVGAGDVGADCCEVETLPVLLEVEVEVCGCC